MRIDNIQDPQTSLYKRCLRVTLLLIVIPLFAVSPLRAQDNGDKIVIQTLKIEPGKTQRLTFQLNNKEEYTAFQTEVIFPQGIIPVKSDDGNYSVSLSSRKANHAIFTNILRNGTLKVAAFSMTNESLTDNSSDLFYIDIISDATFEGPATIEVKEILFTRSRDHKEIAFTDASGIADNHAGTKGDANDDGTVNAADIVEVVNYIMGSPSTKFNVSAADANEDTTVNAADIVRIVNIIMGK